MRHTNFKTDKQNIQKTLLLGVKLSVLQLVCFVSAIVGKSFMRYKIYDVRINKNATD